MNNRGGSQREAEHAGSSDATRYGEAAALDRQRQAGEPPTYLRLGARFVTVSFPMLVGPYVVVVGGLLLEPGLLWPRAAATEEPVSRYAVKSAGVGAGEAWLLASSHKDAARRYIETRPAEAGRMVLTQELGMGDLCLGEPTAASPWIKHEPRRP